jgi:hypothetical protein
VSEPPLSSNATREGKLSGLYSHTVIKCRAGIPEPSTSLTSQYLILNVREFQTDRLIMANMPLLDHYAEVSKT